MMFCMALLYDNNGNLTSNTEKEGNSESNIHINIEIKVEVELLLKNYQLFLKTKSTGNH